MNTGVCKGLDAQSWKDLYQVAIHESDISKLPERITDAETALVMRARELFNTSEDGIAEQESLDYAMCILQALRSSLKHRASAILDPTELLQKISPKRCLKAGQALLQPRVYVRQRTLVFN